MEQLLRITTIPIEYELKVSNAKLERRNGTAELEISRDEGGMKIRSRPIKLHLDTYEARNSVVPTTKSSTQQLAQKGKQAAYEATAQFAKEGQMLLKTKIGEGGEALEAMFAQRVALPSGDFEMGFIPKARANIEWEPANLSIRYDMDKLHFNAKIDKGDVKFIPGAIELSVSQYPDVRIEYVGEPIYIPPSAAARFTGENVDVKA